MSQWKIDPKDVTVLRGLAARKAAIADDPVNVERRRLWYAVDAGAAERTMVLAEAWVAFDDLPEAELECREDWARELEHALRLDIFVFDTIQDDHVVEQLAPDSPDPALGDPVLPGTSIGRPFRFDSEIADRLGDAIREDGVVVVDQETDGVLVGKRLAELLDRPR